MKQDTLADRFGPEGRRAWELSLGIDDAPLIPLQHEESVVEQTVLPFSSASLELLLTAADTLLRRAYAQPRIRGRHAGGATLECILYRAQPWHKSFISSSLWATGNGPPASSGANWKPSSPRLRWRR